MQRHEIAVIGAKKFTYRKLCDSFVCLLLLVIRRCASSRYHYSRVIRCVFHNVGLYD